MELASALTAATILDDATVTPTVSEMTYNVSSGTLNHTQPINHYTNPGQAHAVATRQKYIRGLVLAVSSRLRLGLMEYGLRQLGLEALYLGSRQLVK